MTAESTVAITFPDHPGLPPVRRAADGERKLALLDVDGTLTREHSIWQFVLEGRGRWAGPSTPPGSSMRRRTRGIRFCWKGPRGR
jgi:hypothetical protein